MQKQVTSTQKIIIIVLTIVVIVALYIQYALIPSMDRKSEAIQVNDRAKNAQKEMDNLEAKIEKANVEATEIEVQIEEYKSILKIYEATEDIEADFTKALLDKNLSPLAIKITPEVINQDNPFKKFRVDINASGSLQALISMCGYISNEKSYNMTDLKIVEDQQDYKATMVVSAVYVKEGEPPQDEE